MQNSSRSSHLVVVVDTLPSVRLLEKSESLYEKWLDAVISFSNCHLLLNAQNDLTVIASHFNTNQILYPIKDGGDTSSSPDGQHEVFAGVSQQISSRLKALVTKTREAMEKQGRERGWYSESLLAGALSMALCRIHKMRALFDSSRIAIITASNDSSSSFSSQYMNFMNAFFTAQKMGVVIDTCVAVPDESGGDFRGSILQQGCDITSGMYLKIPNVTAFLEYLIWVLLPDVETRKKLVLPSQVTIGYKASCFCHRNLIDVGYVCSVCLSIFCSFSPICSTCHTIFKLAPLPTKVKKKTTPIKSK
jgi:transcription initiation factor TFIIH subunit 3